MSKFQGSKKSQGGQSSNQPSSRRPPRKRDSKGRFVREDGNDTGNAPQSAPTAPKAPGLTTTRRDNYQDPGSGWTTQQQAAAYRTGANLREVVEDYLSGDRALLYEPPKWLQSFLKDEAKHLRKYLDKRERQERKAVYDRIFCWDMAQLLVAIGLIAGTNVYVALAPGLNLPLGGGANRGFVGTTDPIYSRQIEDGDEIAGFSVTRPYGSQVHPTDGVVKDHDGIDLGTPEKTNIYGLGSSGKVTCNEDPNGYGTFAVIVPSDLPYTFLAGHLSTCVAGDYKAGIAIAQTGNSGKSTGPHLHWEQHKKIEGDTTGQQTDETKMHPTEGYLWWAMQGNPPKPHGGEQAGTAFGSVGDLFARIVAQESGGDASIINPDSGAIGIGQVMPENVPNWTEQCLGQSMSADQFVGNMDVQQKVVDCKLQEYYQAAKDRGEDNFTACRSTAAQWYSGDPSLKDSEAPQNGYPSIRAYTESVCAGYGGES